MRKKLRTGTAVSAVLILGFLSLFAGITSTNSIPVVNAVPGVDAIDNGLQALGPDTAAAWSSNGPPVVTAKCLPNPHGSGKVILIEGSIGNGERGGPERDYTVTMLTEGYGYDVKRVPVGSKPGDIMFLVNTGKQQVQSGQVKFVATWAKDKTKHVWYASYNAAECPKPPVVVPPKITAQVTKEMPKRTYPGRDFVMKVTVRNTSTVPAKFALIDRLPRNRAGKLYMVGYTKAGRLGAHTLGRVVILKPGGVYTQRWRFRVTPAAMLLHYTNCVIVRQVGNSTVLDRDCDWSFDPPA